MNLAIVVANVELKDFSEVNVSVGGKYVLKRTYTHQGIKYGDFTSHSEFYISDGRRKEKIGEKLIEYEAPLTYVEERRIGIIPTPELELRRHQLSLCLKVSEILNARGIRTTITGKHADEIRFIVDEWSELMSNYLDDSTH